MALGPPVCEKCQVIGKYVSTPIHLREHPLINKTHWICPICGNTDMKGHATMTYAALVEYEANLRFLKFCKGIS